PYDTESISPPPLARLVKNRTDPPVAFSLKPVLVADRGRVLSQLRSRKPPGGIDVPGGNTYLRGVFGSLLRLVSARLTALVAGLKSSIQSGVEPAAFEME